MLFAIAGALASACKREKARAEPPSYLYSVRFGESPALEQLFKQGAVVVVRQGDKERHASSDEVTFELESGKRVSDGSVSMALRLHSPCKTVDLPVMFPKLDAAAEAKARKDSLDEPSRTRGRVLIDASVDVPPSVKPLKRGRVWVDWEAGSEKTVAVGSFALTRDRFPTGAVALFDAECEGATRVTIDGEVVGALELEPSVPHDFVISPAPGRCYTYRLAGYGDQGDESKLWKGAQVYKAPSPYREIEYFLTPVPKSVRLAPASGTTAGYRLVQLSRADCPSPGK